MLNQDTDIFRRLILRCLIEVKKNNIFLDILLCPPTMMTWLVVVYFPLFSQHLTNGPATWTDRPHASVRCCYFGQLFSRSQYAKDVAPLGFVRAPSESAADKLSSICGFLRPNRPDFAIQYARYFRRSHISRAMMLLDREQHKLLIINRKIIA